MAIFYVTPTNDLRAVSEDGSDDVLISKAGKVFQASCTNNSDNEQLWVMTSDPDTDPNIGGDVIMVSVMKGSVTSDFKLPGGKKFGAKAIAAGQNSCYFLQEDGSIDQIDQDGNHKQVFPENTALQISKGENGLIVVLSTEIDLKKFGNKIKWFREGDTKLSDDGAVGSQAVGQMGNISYIKPDGDFCSYSPGRGPGGNFQTTGTILRLITNSAEYLAITFEPHKDGGNLMANIGATSPGTISTVAGAVYAEGTSVNYNLFK